MADIYEAMGLTVGETGGGEVASATIAEIVGPEASPAEVIALETIRSLGLEHRVVFNKGSVMILPPNVNKGTGLQFALDELGLSYHNVVGIGDAENDHAFLESCAVAAAVDNALQTLKERCDVVLSRDHGGGVVDLIDRLLGDDLASLGVRRPRKELVPQAVTS